ncbi:MAG TPA: polyphosphate:AMP phosphotransferase [Opitutaceae bacterium]|nr:polyphosphate:AMP phosphotransferase [Opitutaceae bacterium]
MFEAVELGHKIAKEKFNTELPKLRSRLLAAHFALRGQKFPVIVIISGADAAGKGAVVHRLNEWLDPRGVETHAFWQTSDEERERPPYWRYWRAMPGRGRIGIFFGSWYSNPIIRRVHGETDNSQLDAALDRIAAFEKMLVDDGAVIVKLWLHLTRKDQKKALKKLEKEGRVSPVDWKHYKLYDRFIRVTERVIRHTDTGPAPWHLIEATDRRYRELTVGSILLSAIERKLQEATAKAAVKAAAQPATTTGRQAPRGRKTAKPADPSILDRVDLTQKLTDAEYRTALETQQTKLARLTWAAHQKKRSMAMVFEGWDAAGKGSAIRRVTQAMDPRLYRIVGIAAPTDEERAQHYLWRFWRQLPRAGYTTFFDRSWYGRVLVERVEGFAAEADWSRAYLEINEFEEQLTEHGIVVNKFWVHISPDEQLRRFKERQTVSYKQYKITDEDWRNRQKWDAYKLAVSDMVTRCSTEYAPWTLVAGNDKKFARIQILKTVVQRLEEAL